MDQGRSEKEVRMNHVIPYAAAALITGAMMLVAFSAIA